jgi:hypothetical protein
MTARFRTISTPALTHWPCSLTAHVVQVLARCTLGMTDPSSLCPWVRDLLFSAKDLFIAAMVALPAEGGGQG